jgi:hypothetical protein
MRRVFTVPQSIAAGVLRRKHGVFHSRRLGGIGPLAAVELGWREGTRVFITRGPLPLVVGGHAVVDIHPEFPRKKFLLPLGQRLGRLREAAPGESERQKNKGI